MCMYVGGGVGGVGGCACMYVSVFWVGVLRRGGDQCSVCAVGCSMSVNTFRR